MRKSSQYTTQTGEAKSKELIKLNNSLSRNNVAYIR